jgi:hypothetical protein
MSFNHGITPLFYLVLSPFLIAASNAFSKKSLDEVNLILKSVYYILSIIIFLGLLANLDSPEPLGAIIPWVSTNGIPATIIVLQIAYSISYYLKYNRLPLLSAIFTLIIAVFGLGRGSMIVGFAILIFTLIVNVKSYVSKFKNTVYFLIISIGLFSSFAINFFVS